MAAILAASTNVEGKDQELTEAEKKSLSQMTVEEVMAESNKQLYLGGTGREGGMGILTCACTRPQVLERKKALQKHRALVSYYEQKCRRVRRVKSKKWVLVWCCDSNLITCVLCRFHKIQRKRQERLGNKPEVTDEELTKLRIKV